MKNPTPKQMTKRKGFVKESGGSVEMRKYRSVPGFVEMTPAIARKVIPHLCGNSVRGSDGYNVGTCRQA